jgi:hypothetical protein
MREAKHRWHFLIPLAAVICPVDAWAQTSRPSAAERAAMTAAAEADRRRMMEVLHVALPANLPPPREDPNRPAAARPRPGLRALHDDAGNTYVRSDWGTWSNYDEAKANPCPLPDALVMKDGTRVNDARTWWEKRRPEILNDFLTEIYGRIPEHTPKVTWEVTHTDASAAHGTAVRKTIVGHIGDSKGLTTAPVIRVTLYTPKRATGPVPVMVVANSGYAAPAPSTRTAAAAPFDPMPLLLSIGWGYATVGTNAIQADSGGGLDTGVIGLTSGGRPRQPDEWGALTAWAWGLSRVLDYFETDPAVDAKQCGIEGHSRWGKEALWAAALDQRWAICYSSCSGEAGTKLSRRNWGETVDNVCAASEYHWMAGNFLKYAGRWNNLPVDAHELIALVAPRPIFITGGTRDQWSDPRGEFLAAVGADPVYRLLGKKGLGTAEMPAPDVSLVDGELAYRDHEGGHTDAPDWPVFLKFAQRYLHAPGERR